MAAAEARQARLTKPPGALGRLETLAVRLAGLQARERPVVDAVAITVFAADHGVVAEGVSAFPQSVTAAMIANFVSGGAAISVAARQLGARLEIVDLGTVADEATPRPITGVRLHRQRIGPGTRNFAREPAMTEAELVQALAAGRDAVARAGAVDCFAGGEMGIGNTTAATAVACLLTGDTPQALAGPGTGLDADGVARKADVIARALGRHAEASEPLAALRAVGGFEIAALAGAFIACGQRGVPVLVDGYIATVAALVATRLCPGLDAWLIFAHASAEPGHARILEALEAEPLLDLGMRLGEGSGAAAAVPLLRMACTLHNGMATFEEAAVAQKA
jgi:nicotinate-nucleotide--dimethylbenzimidazole phosphoribosyltransferase